MTMKSHIYIHIHMRAETIVQNRHGNLLPALMSIYEILINDARIFVRKASLVLDGSRVLNTRRSSDLDGSRVSGFRPPAAGCQCSTAWLGNDILNSARMVRRHPHVVDLGSQLVQLVLPLIRSFPVLFLAPVKKLI